MNGIYRTSSEDSFVSDEEVKRELALKDEMPEPIFVTERTDVTRPFSYWSARMQRRQADYLETVEATSCVDFRLPDTSLITFQADQHIGGAFTDLKRIEREAELVVNSKNSYVILGGDLLDAFFFNPAQYEDIEQVPEQIEYAKSLVKYYADNKKLLAVWTGNHSQWIKRSGFNPYRYILEGIDTYYFHGVGYMRANIADQELYRITGNHVWKGSSLYSNSHPERRAMNEAARGSDIVFGGHWHQKGISQQAFQSFGGDSQITTMIALGTYKSTDEYIKTYGFSNRDPNSMYGVSVVLDKDRHVVTPYYDVVEAHRRFDGFR